MKAKLINFHSKLEKNVFKAQIFLVLAGVERCIESGAFSSNFGKFFLNILDFSQRSGLSKLTIRYLALHCETKDKDFFFLRRCQKIFHNNRYIKFYNF